jgi:hypothetical protein
MIMMIMMMIIIIYPHKLAIASPTSGGRSVRIVRSRAQTMEFSFFSISIIIGIVRLRTKATE